MALLVLLSMTAMAATGRYDQQIQQAVSHKIHDAKQLQSVSSTVEDGIVTLTGTVGLYQDKLDAAKKVKKLANVTGVRNDIVVAGETVPDGQLQQKLAKKLAYDRVGYYDNAFNYIALNVKDGVVTLTGDTLFDVPKDSALAIVARTPGVKDVVNDVTVLPVSVFDDSIRSAHGSRDLSRLGAWPLRERPGRSDPHRGGQRTRDALRNGRERDGQDHCRNASGFRTGRVQRREQAGGELTGGGLTGERLSKLLSLLGAAQAAPFFIGYWMI